MKKLFAVILAIGLLLCACGSVDIELSIPADSVTQTGLTYQLNVTGSGEFTSDPSYYYLEQNVGGAWVRVDGMVVVGAESTNFSGSGTYTFDLDWSSRYGELPGGLYKLHKIVTINGEEVKYTADFQIVTGALE